MGQTGGGGRRGGRGPISAQFGGACASPGWARRARALDAQPTRQCGRGVPTGHRSNNVHNAGIRRLLQQGPRHDPAKRCALRTHGGTECPRMYKAKVDRRHGMDWGVAAEKSVCLKYQHSGGGCSARRLLPVQRALVRARPREPRGAALAPAHRRTSHQEAVTLSPWAAIDTYKACRTTRHRGEAGSGARQPEHTPAHGLADTPPALNPGLPAHIPCVAAGPSPPCRGHAPTRLRRPRRHRWR